jgi:hypothetical protein
LGLGLGKEDEPLRPAAKRRRRIGGAQTGDGDLGLELGRLGEEDSQSSASPLQSPEDPEGASPVDAAAVEQMQEELKQLQAEKQQDQEVARLLCFF